MTTVVMMMMVTMVVFILRVAVTKYTKTWVAEDHVKLISSQFWKVEI